MNIKNLLEKTNLKYHHDFLSTELNIFSSFVKTQNDQLEDFIKNIKENIVEEEDCFGGNSYLKKHINVLDYDDYYDVEKIYKFELPMYQNQSHLIAIWSILEVELKKMYNYVSNEIGKCPDIPKKQKEISDFMHILKLFNLYGINFNENNQFEKIVFFLDEEVRKLRNIWVHEGGEDKKNKLNINEIEDVDIYENKYNISKNYISKLIKKLFEFSRIVQQSIENFLYSK